MHTYLNGAEDPQYQRLYDHQRCRADADSKVDTDVLANMGVTSVLLVDL